MNLPAAYWEQIKWRKKQLVTIGILSLLLFSLRTPLTQLFNKYIVGLILSQFENEQFCWVRLTIYCGLFLVFGWALYVKCIKQNYQPSLVFLFIIGLACVLYWRERGDQSHYDLYLLVKVKDITYYQLDPIFFLLSLAAIVVLFNYSVNRHFKEGNTFLKQDQPLNVIKDDLIDRSKFYKDVIARIKDIGFENGRSFAIGINSVWGYGKTSLINIIKESVVDKDHIVCVDYNPWLSANKKSLTYDLFSVLEHELAKHVSNTNILLDYAKRVSKVDNDENKLKGLADIIDDDETLRDRFDEITDLIKITGKRFFVYIDDLDRLDNEEVFEVLRLIRNVANFPRLLYIVAYDKYYLINALKAKHIFKPQQYLEKIFELELELPKIDGLKLKQLCHNRLKEGLSRIEMPLQDRSKLEMQINDLIFNSSSLPTGKQAVAAKHFNAAFNSVRDILKFTNSFLLTLSLNKSELYLPDLFLLEIIKLANPDLYHLMASPGKYLSINTAGTNREYQLYIAPVPPVATNEFEISTRVKYPYQLDLIKALFTFPTASDFQHDKAIVRVDNFKTYFIFAEPQGIMAFDEIDQILRA
jgi:predicted KAP-like P-loop ATPase